MSGEQATTVLLKVPDNAAEASPEPQYCIREGCVRMAIRSPEWEDEYCSPECVVAHCKAIFDEWCRNAKQEAANKAAAQNHNGTKD
jgi:hypothetical protein